MMTCGTCGGPVLWMGPITNLMHTECQDCGRINNQIVDAQHEDDDRCTSCDGTGDLHLADGEWLGECTACDAAEQHRAAAQEAAIQQAQSSAKDGDAVGGAE